MHCLRVLTPLPEWDRPTRAHAPTGRAFQPGPGSIHGRSVAVLPAGASGTSLLAEASFRRLLLPGRDVLVPRRRCRLEEEAASSAPRWPEGPPRESGPISCIRLRSVVAPAAASRVLRVSFPRPRGRISPAGFREGDLPHFGVHHFPICQHPKSCERRPHCPEGHETGRRTAPAVLPGPPIRPPSGAVWAVGGGVPPWAPGGVPPWAPLF